MNYSLTVQHIELSQLDQQLLNEKLQRLRKLIDYPATIDVVIRHDTHHRQGHVVTCIINMHIDRHHLHIERAATTVQDALDEAITALREGLRKHHDKHTRQRWSIKRWLGW